MYGKKKKNNKYVYIGIGICLLVLLTISLLTQRSGNHKNNVLKTISMGIDKVVMYPFTSLNSEKGKKQTESYTIQKNANAHCIKKSTLEMAWIVTIVLVVGNGGYSPILGSYGLQ